jgi:hypothetical protein
VPLSASEQSKRVSFGVFKEEKPKSRAITVTAQSLSVRAKNSPARDQPVIPQTCAEANVAGIARRP